jgi:hypothetical protein
VYIRGVRSGLAQVQKGPDYLNFGLTRSVSISGRAWPAHGLARNFLNVSGLCRTDRNYKKPEIQFLAHNSIFGRKFISGPQIHIRDQNSKQI